MPKQVTTVKPYCKVCHDAGKSEKEYTSHYVRSAPGPEGKVVCPTLLSQECGYCGDCGHTPKFCPTLAAQKAAEQKAQKQVAKKAALEKREAAPKPAAQAKKPTNANIFAALDSDSDTETQPKKQVSKAKTTSTIQTIFSDLASGRVVPNLEIKTSIPTIFSDAAAAREAARAAKLDPKSNEFPELSAATTKSNTTTVKPVAAKGKPQFLSALNQLCPELNVAAKMPEVHTVKPPMAKLVRKDEFINDYISNKLGSDSAYQQHDRRLTAELAQHTEEHCGYDSEEEAYGQQMYCNGNGYDVTEYYEEALKAFQAQRAPMKASQMNWAMTSDSDDEDW
jgi:hypothetical protein